MTTTRNTEQLGSTRTSTYRSFVSCNPWCSGFIMCSLYSDDKILAMAGLQISQPWDSGFTPTVSIMVLKSLSFLILTTWKRSTRDMLKWMHRLPSEEYVESMRTASKRAQTDDKRNALVVEFLAEFPHFGLVDACNERYTPTTTYITFLSSIVWTRRVSGVCVTVERGLD